MFGYASSRDLINWSQQRAIPAMVHEPEARNCWAPEIFHDKASDRFLIFWSSTIPGRFPATDASGNGGDNHRVYYTTTKDFQQFAPTRLFYDGGFNVIDATMIHALGKYHLIVKDETRNPVARKNLRICTSESPEGPWSSASEPFTISWVEGPSVVQIGDEYIVYFDHYARPQYYGAIKTRDFKTWEDITGQVSFPHGARHGTVFPVPEAALKKLLELK
jgi:beta-xylosidase